VTVNFYKRHPLSGGYGVVALPEKVKAANTDSIAMTNTFWVFLMNAPFAVKTPDTPSIFRGSGQTDVAFRPVALWTRCESILEIDRNFHRCVIRNRFFSPWFYSSTVFLVAYGGSASSSVRMFTWMSTAAPIGNRAATQW
jgi:hypothetical protein